MSEETLFHEALARPAHERAAFLDAACAGRPELRPDLVAAPGPDEELLALDAALARFAERDPLKARLVELRYFAGLTGAQAAEALGISPSTADRHWVYARAWLRREMRADAGGKAR